MEELLNEVRQSYVKRLRNAQFPDKVFMIIRGQTGFTPNQLADEIENQTEVGNDQIKNLLELAAHLITRDKTKM